MMFDLIQLKYEVLNLEEDVLNVLMERLEIQISRPGMYLLPSHPIFAASSDGLTSNAIVWIKCSSVNTFLPKNKISSKCIAQMQLQMVITVKKKEIFCVADPDLEENQIIYVKTLKYDEAHTQDQMKKNIDVLVKKYISDSLYIYKIK